MNKKLQAAASRRSPVNDGASDRPAKSTVAPKKKRATSKPLNDGLYWVGIGASAGGLEALREVLKALPKNAQNITYIIAQHLSPKHQSMLVQLLGRETTMTVEEVRNGLVPEGGTIYITPPNSDVFVRDGEMHLSRPPSELSPKPSVDYFFATLAQEIGDHAIGVILSGTGSDGSHGVRAVKAEGGLTIAQDPEEAKYDGMPANAIGAGCVDLVLPAAKIGPQILSIIRTPSNLKLLQEEEITRSTMHELLHLLKERSGVDFRDYKSGTLYRRINRRMTACATTSVDDYLDYVKRAPNELDLLFKDIMISVTYFFRDTEAFTSLTSVIKKLLADKGPGSDIRIWIPGCATGEEAYSIVILFAEAAGGIRQLQQNYSFQLFATDIDTDALSLGRKGVYSATTLESMAPDIRDRYFRHKEESYEIIKSVRDMVMFSRHNVFSDPPFLRLDFISCRNLLIYFNAKLQATVMNLFHYALNPNGILYLGKSEALGNAASLFQPIDNRAKIYQRKLVSSYEAIRSAKASYSTVSKNVTPATPAAQTKSNHDFPDAVIAALSPDSLLIDENMNLLRVYGDVQPYTQLSPGEASTNLVSIARKEFRQELRALVYKVVRERDQQAVLPKKLVIDGKTCRINIHIRPLPLKNSGERLLLVSFEQTKEIVSEVEDQDGRTRTDPMLAELEQELAATKEHLQTVVEELETSNEELQSTNEEMQSTNEELQSSNEELETANEELQSTNEELLTVNEELQIKSAELSNSNEDLENIKESINIPIIVVDKTLRVTRHNACASEIFLLNDNSIGETIGNIGTRIDVPDLRTNIVKVIENGVFEERRLKSGERFHIERIQPYRDGDGRVNGAVLTYFDDTYQQQMLEELRVSQERYRLATEGSQAGMWDWDITANTMVWSDLLLRMLGIRDPDFTASLDELKERIHEQDRRDIMDILQAHLDRGFEFDVEFRMRRENGTYFWANASGQAMWGERKDPQRMTGFIYDVTERRQTLEHLSRTNESLERFAYVCSHDLKEPARSIENFASLVLQDFSEQLDADGKTYVKYIHECAMLMQQMVKGILNYSQLESKNLAFEDIDLEQELAKVLDNLKLSIEEADATITHDPLPLIRADRMQIFQLFLNLIGNALKFCRGRKPKVHISVEDTSRGVKFGVHDNGIGIKPEHLQKIFNVFQRLNRREEFPGTGVGLSICQKVVNRHGGRLWVESEFGKGSSFYFDLPYHPSRSIARATETIAG
ncbi:chemotaxis protein CheB [Rhizobium halophytocola]|uniref:Two-component system CheB/CheR fusion protein n=1 Tax=Rhizobium halophytocola TaxID=735519 RepID=A0ABS4E6H4_9HYPH|nr:two-component system CheB/CheR fusion protein [Rhizobium halophytocola]